MKILLFLRKMRPIFFGLLSGWLVLVGRVINAQDIVIVSQPANQDVGAGGIATFAVVATNLAINYQWRFNASNILGATNPNLILTNVQAFNVGAYDCVLTDASGSLPSRAAQLRVFAKYWTGLGDGTNWTTGANWNGGTVPSTTDDVLINVPTNVSVVTSQNTATQVEGLVCRNGLVLQATLTVTGRAEVYGPLTVISGAAISASGLHASFRNFGNVVADGASFYATGGGSLTISELTSFNTPASSTFEATGIGSVLRLPSLSQINGPAVNAIVILHASGGGYLDLPSVTNIIANLANPGGGVRGTRIISEEQGSEIILSGLVNFSERAGYGANSYIEVQNGASINLDSLASVDGPSIYVNGGSSLTLPNLASWEQGGGGSRYLSVEGSGSVLSLPSLPLINGPNGDYSVSLHAYGGGSLNLSAVTNIIANQAGSDNDPRNTTIVVEDLWSTIDLSSLQSFVELLGYGGGSYIVAQNGGDIKLDSLTTVNGPSIEVYGGSSLTLPKLTTWDQGGGGSRRLEVGGAGSQLSLPVLPLINGPNGDYSVYLHAYGGGYLNLGAVTNILANQAGSDNDPRSTTIVVEDQGSSIDLSSLQSFVELLGYGGGSYIVAQNGGDIKLDDLTVVNGPSIEVYGGSTLTMPKLTSWDQGGGGSRRLEVGGEGSQLSLPVLPKINGPNGDYSVYLHVYGGGYLNLGAVTSIVANQAGSDNDPRSTQIVVEDQGSTIDLSSLLSFVELLGYGGQSYIVVQNGGRISLDSLTTVNGPAIAVYGGSSVTLPRLTSWDQGAGGNRSLTVGGNGSRLSLPSLGRILGPNGDYNISLHAYGGGYLDLSGVTNIIAFQAGSDNGPRSTTVLAESDNSVINLSGLVSFLSPNSASSLTEATGGTIFLNPAASFGNASYLLVGNSNPPNAALGVPYSTTFVPLGGKAPYTWALGAGSLPPGLRLSLQTGVITGRPTAVGAYSFQLQLTDATGRQAVTDVSVTVASPDAGFLATQSLPGYVTLGTNTVTCQISYPLGRQLYSLLWQPILPPEWTLISARGDGSAELQAGQIAFTSAQLPNPLNFTFTVVTPTNQSGVVAIGGTVAFWMDGMSDVETTSATPSPLLVTPAKRHSADFEDPAWVIDGTELNRMLAYWRAQGYQIDPNSIDGYTVGIGNTNGPLSTADFEAPFWLIDGTEVNRVLAYWRAGAYHPDSLGSDGFAPGILGVGGPGLVTPLNATENHVVVTQSAPPLYLPGSILNITNTVEYDGTLLSLLVRPALPDGWKLHAVSGPGEPQGIAGEIVWTGTIPSSPFEVVYSVDVPLGVNTAQRLSSEVEYQSVPMVNPVTASSSPDLFLATVRFISPPEIVGSKVGMILQGVPGSRYLIQASSDLQIWATIAVETATQEGVQVFDTASPTARFYRALLVSGSKN